jgi:type I restriction enzyme S subunit
MRSAMTKPMNKIEKLIAELCPEGVEFMTLGEVGTLIRGNGLQKKDFTENGVGCIHYGQIHTYYRLFADKTKTFVSPDLSKKLKKAQKGDVLIAGVSENIEDVCKPLGWLGDEICIGGDMFAFRHNQHTKFITYLLMTIDFQKYKERYAQGAKVTRVRADKILDYKIPIPPLPIQQEIVKILDTFTTLEAELEAELEARKKQYEYYRSKLLTFNERERWLTLGEACLSITAGGDLPEKYLKGQNMPTKEFPYPIFSNGSDENALYGYTNNYKIDREAVTVSARGTIGYHAVRGAKFTPIVRLLTLIANTEIITSKFLNYALDITEIGHSGGSIPQLTVPNVKKIKIPIPPIAEQERIVTILDKFDALVNDISVGLPAELNARRKQYEHYRNKLLSFKEYE